MSSNDEADEIEVIVEEHLEESGELAPFTSDPDTTCTLCNAEFLDPDDLRIHLEQVHNITSIILRKCQFCPEQYTDMMNYAVHIRDIHMNSLKCCVYCLRVFSDTDEYKNHIRKHFSKSGTFSCSQCNQRHAERIWLRKHEYDHKNCIEGVMLHEIFPYLSAVLKCKSTTFLESLGSNKQITCVGCDSSFYMNEYIKHAASQNCEVFACNMCGHVSKQKKNLTSHIKRTKCTNKCDIFSVQEKQTKLCEDCNIHIPLIQYSSHKKRCKPIKCYTCQITFKTMNEWSEHQSQNHSGAAVEVETCKFCWKRCVGSIAMKKHIEKTHKHEFHLYKYFCVYCNSIFKHPQKLFGHFASQHRDIHPFSCKICNETFRFRKKLTIHIKLKHKSVGFVEFDENYHVFFTENKSENPFIPSCLYTHEGDDNDGSEKSENFELNSDFMNATETEGNVTEVEGKPKKQALKRKRTTKVKKYKKDLEESVTIESSEEEDDQPLLEVRKKVRFLQRTKNLSAMKAKLPSKMEKRILSNRASLTCKICNKYCYTFQNYNHHVSLHSRKEFKKCIKCDKVFKSKTALNEHVTNEHVSSKLTETLKTLIEKRKNGTSFAEDLPISEKFRRTIKKVNNEISTSSARIVEADHKISVQKFLENFVPEDVKPEPLEIIASMKIVSVSLPREPTIKMTKFKSNPISHSLKLAMPTKFVDHYPEKTKITMKMVEPYQLYENEEHFADNNDSDDMDQHESIPEVAEEVMLENTEEPPKQHTFESGHKIVIPTLSSELNNIRIAHLLPQAPYYKIVKVKDVLVQNTDDTTDQEKRGPISLPNGTKLVTANPLAHLLGNKQSKVLQSVKNKYYKPRIQNFEGMLAKALTMLDTPTLPYKKKKKEDKAESIKEESLI